MSHIDLDYKQDSMPYIPMHAGVILLSEDLHRVAYNAAFQHFQIRCKGEGCIADWCVLPVGARKSVSTVMSGQP